MKRVDGWREALDQAVFEMRRKPFVWGENDCALGLAGNVTRALLGTDLSAPWRGRYSSRIGALRVLRNDGFEDLADLVATVLPEIHPAQARIGDLAAVEADAMGHALGVFNGERVFVLREDGWGTVDRAQARRAFKVG
ncbi:hypothetical protein DL1_11985 [Thioclava dalianensis]|uniref:DUF6950 domain-containing protein n=1 Tax=Thioclava dalianensis TaxID=1185766 RepID=A0A074THB4_9RHOB|nr:hypothetical protein [Thioclava dalianensis]KEP68418.1 hypothetical protein DL1_11985 [Thioclava dalianensis]SFN62860.1 hypothetical protein SAMN05216224_10860 [Thioclava dalianensis]